METEKIDITLGVTTYYGSNPERLNDMLKSILDNFKIGFDGFVEVIVAFDEPNNIKELDERYLKKRLQVLDIIDNFKKIIETNYSKIANFKQVSGIKNERVSVMRNVIIDMAKGDFTLFADDDDLFSKNAFKTYFDAIKEHKEENPDIIDFNVEDDSGPIYNVWARLYNTRFLRQNNIAFTPKATCEDVPYLGLLNDKAKKICFGDLKEKVYKYCEPSHIGIETFTLNSLNKEEVSRRLKNMFINSYSSHLIKYTNLVNMPTSCFQRECRRSNKTIYDSMENSRFSGFLHIQSSILLLKTSGLNEYVLKNLFLPMKKIFESNMGSEFKPIAEYSRILLDPKVKSIEDFNREIDLAIFELIKNNLDEFIDIVSKEKDGSKDYLNTISETTKLLKKIKTGEIKTLNPEEIEKYFTSVLWPKRLNMTCLFVTKNMESINSYQEWRSKEIAETTRLIQTFLNLKTKYLENPSSILDKSMDPEFGSFNLITPIEIDSRGCKVRQTYFLGSVTDGSLEDELNRAIKAGVLNEFTSSLDGSTAKKLEDKLIIKQLDSEFIDFFNATINKTPNWEPSIVKEILPYVYLTYQYTKDKDLFTPKFKDRMSKRLSLLTSIEFEGQKVTDLSPLTFGVFADVLGLDKASLLNNDKINKEDILDIEFSEVSKLQPKMTTAEKMKLQRERFKREEEDKKLEEQRKTFERRERAKKIQRETSEKMKRGFFK